MKNTAQTLTCTLCENRCPLTALGCRKGQRFYEESPEPYCTLCENHCLLSSLQCERGVSFYEPPQFKYLHLIDSPDTLDFNGLYEICYHQFSRLRGGTSSQIRVLRYLHNHGQVSQSTLQEALSMKAATLSELLTRMEHQDLIERDVTNYDKRGKMIFLTESGKAAYAQQAAHEERLHIFSALTDTEKETLRQLLSKLHSDWNERERAG